MDGIDHFRLLARRLREGAARWETLIGTRDEARLAQPRPGLDLVCFLQAQPTN